MKYCPDANIFITGWNEAYPPDVFPGLWPQIAREKDQYILIKPIFDEIDPYNGNDKKSLTPEQRKEKYPLRTWLEDIEIDPQPVPEDIQAEALKLESEYETKNTDTCKGANKNDIQLIAYAKVTNNTVVTFEAEQPNKPGKKYNYKIPLICKLEQVQCINFVALLRKLEIKVS